MATPLTGQIPPQPRSDATAVVLGMLVALVAIGIVAILYLAANAKSDLDDAKRNADAVLCSNSPYMCTGDAPTTP